MIIVNKYVVSIPLFTPRKCPCLHNPLRNTLVPHFRSACLSLVQRTVHGDMYCSWPSVLWRSKRAVAWRTWTSRDPVSGDVTLVQARRASLRIRLPTLLAASSQDSDTGTAGGDAERAGKGGGGDKGGRVGVRVEEQSTGDKRSILQDNLYEERGEDDRGDEGDTSGDVPIEDRDDDREDGLNELVEDQTHIVLCLATERNHKYRVYMKGNK